MCYFWDFGNSRHKTYKKILLERLFRKIIKHGKMRLRGLKELQKYCRSQINLSVQCIPVDWGTWQLSLTRKVTCHSSPLCSNTNTDSGVLVPDIFNYLVSTFISSHLLLCNWIAAFPFSYFKLCCTSEDRKKEKITTVSSNFYGSVLDSGSLGVYSAHC